MYARPINLFRERGINSIISSREMNITREIDAWDDVRLLNVDVDGAVSDFTERFRLTPPELHLGRRVIEEPKRDIGEEIHSVMDRFGEGYEQVLPAENYVALIVPYSGGVDMLDIEPNPCIRRSTIAKVNDSQLIVYVPVGRFSTDDPVPQIESMLEVLRKNIDSLTENCREWNKRIGGIVAERIQQQQERIQNKREYYNSINARMSSD